MLKREVAINKQRLSNMKTTFSDFQSKSTQLILPVDLTKGESSRLQENDVEKINYISKIYNQKWLSRITIKVQDFKLEAIALIDSGADQDAI